MDDRILWMGCKRSIITFLLVSFGFTFSSATTAFNHPHYSSSSPRPPIPQFQKWYPNHNRALINFTHAICNASYADYLTAFHSPRGSRDASYLRSTCYELEGCLLDAIPANWQANYNSANIILGLMPTLLASSGPSLAEISLLSAHRPLLSFLISMGALAIWPTRILEYVHPTETVRQRRGSLRINKIRPWPAAMISLGQYIFAIGAMANVITTSIEVNRQSILSFGCTTTFGPLLWSTLASAIHFVSVLSYFFVRKMAPRQISVEQLPPKAESSETKGIIEQVSSGKIQVAQSGIPQQRFHRVWLSRLRDAWLSETTICANHSKCHDFQDQTAVPRVAILLAIGAGVMSFCHVTFGIVIFSSLQFISVDDALRRILWRYIFSSLVCRLLLIVEMAGLRTISEAEES